LPAQTNLWLDFRIDKITKVDRTPPGVFTFCSFVIELFSGSVMLRLVKRNLIETVETPNGARAAHLNPVEVEIIHLFVQLSRALGHPC